MLLINHMEDEANRQVSERAKKNERYGSFVSDLVYGELDLLLNVWICRFRILI